MSEENVIRNRIKERMDELNVNRPENEQITPHTLAEAAGVTTDFIYRLMRQEKGCSQKVQFAIVRVLESTTDDIFMPLK